MREYRKNFKILTNIIIKDIDKFENDQLIPFDG